MDNAIYYYLDPGDRRRYRDFSGTGNTLNCNRPIVAKLILDCLEYWVREMHVDGFRFDEASILSRGEDGAPMATPPALWQIELSETLANTKIIAEAWDAAGLYEIGYFPGYRWAEWNGRYRDDLRRFVRGDPGLIGAVAQRLTGSADLYQRTDRLPINSLNFVTCHDGFTLNDLVSYNQKHNEANGEDNRDGSNDNLSWNCGAEGETADPAVEALRERQIRNLAALLLLSRGVPMLLAGDEVRRSQRGNNNAYCQDNETSWLDWGLVERNRGLLRFFQQMIAFRKRHRVLWRGEFFSGRATARGLPDIEWHGRVPRQPHWDDPENRCLACTIAGEEDEADLHLMLNMEAADVEFEVPSIAGRSWGLAIDTARPALEDICEQGQEPPISAESYYLAGHSLVVLVSRPAEVSVHSPGDG